MCHSVLFVCLFVFFSIFCRVLLFFLFFFLLSFLDNDQSLLDNDQSPRCGILSVHGDWSLSRNVSQYAMAAESK